ncbi:GNAT family N-acetyltransferase [Pseudonocardia saturnea]
MIRTARLVLEPLRVDHAEEMATVLADPALYAVIGGVPPSVDELRARYARQVAGPAEGQWLNWVVRHDGTAVGYVQATVTAEHAELAWVIGTAFQGHGYAREAAAAVVATLDGPVVAHIRPGHTASENVAAGLGFRPTGAVVDGELRWASPPPASPPPASQWGGSTAAGSL